MGEIRPDSLVICKNGLVFEFAQQNAPAAAAFCVALGEGLGFIEFVRLNPGPAIYRSNRWLADLSQAQGQLVSVRGVLWTRRAALEADLGIAAFLAQGGLLHESAPQ